jgi:hypothetical protein
MNCSAAYPDQPPTIQFVSQVNLPCVNPRNGVVDPKQLPCLANWKRENTMETILIELRRYVGFAPVRTRCRKPWAVADLLSLCFFLGTWHPRRIRRSRSLQKAPYISRPVEPA